MSTTISDDHKHMEPKLETDPELAGVLGELSAREPIFHRPEFGATRADFENMTAADFWEVGASGRRYSREYVLHVLEKRCPVSNGDIWEARDFHCTKLADNVFLLTYTLLQDDSRVTRRATVWQRTSEGWKVVYHQGTIVQDTPSDRA